MKIIMTLTDRKKACLVVQEMNEGCNNKNGFSAYSLYRQGKKYYILKTEQAQKQVMKMINRRRKRNEKHI